MKIMKSNIYFILIYLLPFTISQLKKHSFIETYYGAVLFESKDFQEGEEMHFKVKAELIDIRYEYIDYSYVKNIINDFTYTDRYSYGFYTEYFKSSDYYSEGFIDYRTVYFSIEKKKSEFGNTNGDYLLIFLPVDFGTWAYIENTVEDEGKIETWVIIVIVVVIVAVIVGIIIFFVVRRIKRQKAIANTNAALANNIAMQQNYQAQAYQAQVYQNQIAQAQAYQQEMNPAPVYQEQNYPNTIGYNNDVAYSSKQAENI